MLCEKEDKVILSIEDNGIGILKQDIDRVFNPFLQVKMVENILNLLVWAFIFPRI